MVAKLKVCKDCQATSLALLRKPRPASYPGPRCATHYREFRRKTKKATADKRAEKMYGITPDEYQALLVAQDGRCAWCRRKIGTTVRAAIDHDHSCEVCGGTGCRECVRGLLDRKCNEILGWFGDDPNVIVRGVWYLVDPPARAVLRRVT